VRYFGQAVLIQGAPIKPKVDEATKRRIRGGRMLLAGKKPSEVACAVGVSRQTAYSWKAVIEDGGGIEALRNLSRGGDTGEFV
jgi:transposase